MGTNYREQLNMPNLKTFLGVNSLNNDLNVRQRRAINNIKWCANDQWAWVNSWLDERSESARQYVMNARELFDMIYHESLVTVYREGITIFNRAAEAYLKDIRFCGKAFLQKVVFYSTAKFLEDSVPEVGGTEEEAEKVAQDLRELKAELNIG